MAFMSKSWLVALLSVASLRTSYAYPSVTNLAARSSDDDIQLPPSVPAKIKVTDKPADPAGKLVKIRYGPYTLPPNSVVAGLPEQVGGPKIHKPCDECYLGAFQGGLEYEDGSEANVDTGMYLHHFVLVNNNKPDWLCGLRLGAMFRPQYVYNSGNERPPVRLNSKYKFGMRVDKQDTFSTAAELMNMSNETRTVYATLVYEVIPLNTPGYREATHLRIDVWQCGGSDVPAKTGAYQYTSPKFVSPYAGAILHTDGHGHDGTTEVNLMINGNLFCKSTQYYGLRKSATQPHHIAVHHGESSTVAMQYISDAVACEDYGRVEKGDVIWAEAFYNGTKYPQMVFKGHRENQMGIHFLYIGRDEGTLHDKIPLEPKFDEFPKEMNVTSGFGFGMLPGTPPSAQVNSTAITFNSILSMYGMPTNANLSAIFPTIPPDFNMSNPVVEAPFSPMEMPSMDLSAFLPGLPAGPLNLTDPKTLEVLEGMARQFVPGLPKDFKLSKIITPGGIIISEMQELMDEVRKSMGIPKDPLEEIFGGHGHRHRRSLMGQKISPVMARSLARLDRLRH